MRIQHNILAMNSYRNYSNNTNALGKNLEKLSSGYKINRAGDDAAGLAISEKMRAQIQGLSAAQKNVKDGISLVKTAEGAMQEIQDMLNRMKYLATQSANGTYQNAVDRENLQQEVDNLKSEIDRIAQSANFNGIELLYKKASGDPTDPDALDISTYANGPVALEDATKPSGNPIKTTITAASMGGNLKEVSLGTTGVSASTLDTKTLTFTVDINGTKKTVSVTLVSTSGSVAAGSVGTHIAVKGTVTANDLKTAIESAFSNWLTSEAGQGGSAAAKGVGTWVAGASVKFDNNGKLESIEVTSQKYVKDTGDDDKKTDKIGPNTADAKIEANVKEKIPTYTSGSKVTVNGKTYVFVPAATSGAIGTHADGNEIQVKLGADKVKSLQNLAEAVNAHDDDLNFDVSADGTLTIKPAREMTVEEYEKALNGLNLGSDDLNNLVKDAAKKVIDALKDDDEPFDSTIYTPISKGGPINLELQIGDTGKQYNILKISIDSMDCESIGVKGLLINNLKNAQKAVDDIEKAINTVSTNRGKLGALQNRLEHTQNNLSVMAENIQDAESGIRDTDVADEMMGYVKNNILVQSAQAMLAQANQVPQGVLQLLG